MSHSDVFPSLGIWLLTDSWLRFQASVRCPVWNIKDGRFLCKSFTFSFHQFLHDVSIFFAYAVEASLNVQSSQPDIVNFSFLGNRVALRISSHSPEFSFEIILAGNS